jgi:hypothetical protein
MLRTAGQGRTVRAAQAVRLIRPGSTVARVDSSASDVLRKSRAHWRRDLDESSVASVWEKVRDFTLLYAAGRLLADTSGDAWQRPQHRLNRIVSWDGRGRWLWAD